MSRRSRTLRLLPFVLVVVAAFLASLAFDGKRTTTRTVPTSVVAPEVCTGNGLPRKVTLTGDVYRVVCASGLIQEVQK